MRSACTPEEKTPCAIVDGSRRRKRKTQRSSSRRKCENRHHATHTVPFRAAKAGGARREYLGAARLRLPRVNRESVAIS
jgi:hypothetical protein